MVLIGAPKYIKEVGAAVGGTVEETLVEYLRNARQATDSLKGWERPFLLSLELDAVQQALGRVFEDYELYLETFQHQLSKFAAGQEFNELLAAGVASLENFSLKQQDLYYTVRNGLNDAPSE
ncbi:hypothetical protein BASA83_012429 [Batrachochytrium salamandrivorans]|nr:hypothetical protein BASA83_012429 [Batrachochytrium salamandrivorans]